MQDSIKKEQLFDHSIDQVWKAISEGQRISEWFIQADFKPEEGYAYTFTADEDSGCTQITGIVKKATPYELIYTWVVGGTDVETTVSWQLERAGTGTKLILVHSGISNYPKDTAVKMFESFQGGWVNCLNLLSQYLPIDVAATY